MLSVWMPVAIITALHYGTPHEYHWIHDVLRRLYYLPIVIAAVRLGFRGGIAAAFVVTLCYGPHAFLMEGHHFDPGRGMEKGLEMALYFIVAALGGYLSDLERQRRAELQVALDEQQRLSDQLIRAGRLSALGEVVAGIAHEIKNPLHALIGTAEIVDPLIPPEAEERRMWELHKGELVRLRRVSERFLNFAKPAQIELEPLDLSTVVARLQDLIDAEARQKSVTLKSRLADQPVMVGGDLDQLVQVGLNIAVNGIKALEATGGRLELSTGTEENREQSMAYLRVENDGPPITEEEMNRLFDPFWSGEDGAGLGLSISARIAEQHGGYIESENAGLGVRFTLYLPSLRTNNGLRGKEI